MTTNTPTIIGLILLVLGSGACSDLASPAAPSRSPVAPTVPALPSEPRLVTFTEPGSGFSTTDLHDADDEILQINSHNQLIWVADGTLLSGYAVDSHTIGGVPIHWITGKICSPDGAFEVRFGAKTVDHGGASFPSGSNWRT